jgi:SAM-dependent methyltransferase
LHVRAGDDEEERVGILSRERESAVVSEAWPLAARAAAGLVSPGGTKMVKRAAEGTGLDRNSRVVELDAGFGVAARILLAHEPRGWTAVDEDPLAVEHLSRAVGVSGRAVRAPAPATGLEDGCASIVLLDGVLCLRDDDSASAVLTEAARLLRSSGRLAVIDLVPADGGERGLQSLSQLGVTARGLTRLRELVSQAGLTVVGSTEGPLRPGNPRELARAAGPKMAMKLAREASDERVRRAATRVRQAMEEAGPHLRAGLVVAERPLVMGLLRPR